ncbi:MAG: hypothetical protein AB4041_12385 [Microcystaceae cyanobacterium]
MTQRITRSNEPFYGKIWGQIKRFPQFLHQGNDNPPELSGEAAAAFLSTAIGAIAMMIAHHIADADQTKTVQAKLLTLGSWIPGAANPDPLWGNIGNYTGKETVLLLAWLISWIVLYFMLKDRQVKTATLFVWMIGLMTLATAMCWHPLFPYLPLI